MIFKSQIDWQPTASISHLKARANILSQIRAFFAECGVMEVETPILAHAPVTDPYIQSMVCNVHYRGTEATPLYLQTSPEYAMKRLLAAGSGPIYQIAKAFRDEEIGAQHNPEFTMLEWYRPGFDHFALMDEVDALLQHVLHTTTAERMTYQALFQTYVACDPLTADLETLLACAEQRGVMIPEGVTVTSDVVLQCLMSDVIEPKIGQDCPIMIYHYPASQSALAKIHVADPRVAERFEVYYQGMELANGFHELQCSDEQRQRFEANCVERASQDLPAMPIDDRLLAALQHGLPDCAGVALGIDRLVMLALKATQIRDIIAFPTDLA